MVLKNSLPLAWLSKHFKIRTLLNQMNKNIIQGVKVYTHYLGHTKNQVLARWQENALTHIHPVNHRLHGNRTTPSLLCCSVRSESGCTHSIDKGLLLDAPSIDTPQLISLIHLDKLAELQQIHCNRNMFPGCADPRLGYLRRSYIHVVSLVSKSTFSPGPNIIWDIERMFHCECLQQSLQNFLGVNQAG